MTMNEQHQEIGRMYVEREEVERQLACIANKLARLRKKLVTAADVIERRNEKGMQLGIDDLPTKSQIIDLLQSEGEYQLRLQELNNFFEARRK